MKPGEDIGKEVHHVDQILVFIQGHGIATLNGEREQGLMAQWLADTERAANDTDAEVRARLLQVVPELQ